MKSAFLLFMALAAVATGGPLKFEAILKEVHLPADSQTVTIDFPFVNESKGIARIKRYDATCSCMTVAVKDGKLNYGPGESGLIRAIFDMGNFSGTVDKSVTVYVDDDPEGKPSLILTGRIHIPVLVQAEPKTVKWVLGQKPEEQIVRITMHHTDPIHVVRVQPSIPNIRHELRTVQEGREYELVLKPNDDSGPCLGIFRIETDCAIEKHRIQQVFAVVRKEGGL